MVGIAWACCCKPWYPIWSLLNFLAKCTSSTTAIKYSYLKMVDFVWEEKARDCLMLPSTSWRILINIMLESSWIAYTMTWMSGGIEGINMMSSTHTFGCKDDLLGERLPTLGVYLVPPDFMGCQSRQVRKDIERLWVRSPQLVQPLVVEIDQA